MLQPWRTGKITRIEEAIQNTRRFFVEVPELTEFDFKPGQFVTLDLPIHEKPNKRWRSYSIASPPDGTNGFELVISLMEHGAGTHYLFEQVSEGSELVYRGPQGVFTLPEEIDRDLYFICTGTGIAPFRSMAQHILNNNVPHKEIYLIFGCRKFTDTLYEAELKELQSDFPQFHYIPTFSREQPNDPSIHTGYVHKVYEDIIKSKMNSTSDPDVKTLPPSYFFLCGWKNMIDEAKKRIQELGYDRKSIHQELYG